MNINKKLLLTLCAGLLIGAPQGAQASTGAKIAGASIGATLFIAGTYAGLSGLYQLSERGHKFGWFLTLYHKISAATGLATAGLGIAAFVIGMNSK